MTDIADPRAKYFCSKCQVHGHTLAERHCSMCGAFPVRHKIGEEGYGYSAIHNLTNYLCCEHFTAVVGDCSELPSFGHREDYPHLFTEPAWLRDLDEPATEVEPMTDTVFRCRTCGRASDWQRDMAAPVLYFMSDDQCHPCWRAAQPQPSSPEETP